MSHASPVTKDYSLVILNKLNKHKRCLLMGLHIVILCNEIPKKTPIYVSSCLAASLHLFGHV